MPMPTDEGCGVPAAKVVDRAALEERLLGLVPRVRNLIRYLVRRDSDVDDIAQEALIVLARALQKFEVEGSFDAWVGRIVARATFAYLRRHRGHMGEAVEMNEQVEEEIRESGAVRPIAEVDEFMERRTIAALLDQLSYEQRQAVVLHHVLELNVPEIATELHVSVETVRSRLRLARARLRAGGLDLFEDETSRSSPQ